MNTHDARWVLMCMSVMAGASGCGHYSGAVDGPQQQPTPRSTQTSVYALHNLVSDGSITADHTDANLVNPWGIAFNPSGPVWVSNNATSTSTLYDGTGTPYPNATVALVVAIPAGANGDAKPTGIVYNATSDFGAPLIGPVPSPGPTAFIFAGEGGTIAAWGLLNLTRAVTVYDDAAGGAIYKGLAIASNAAGANFIYATDFHNNKIDVFDGTFTKATAPGGFVDAAMPVGFAPFGIQNIQNKLVVTYAQQDANAEDNVDGAGLGYVDEFDADGHLLKRLISGGVLNAPWGVALAPADFGQYSNDLLIGNFGDGTINVFDPATGASLGALAGRDGSPLSVDGLWGIAFGTGANSQPLNTLFFAAGPNDEANGVYGSIVLTNEQPGGSGATLAQIQTNVFSPHCASCHSGQGTTLPGSMDLTSAQASFDNLVNVTSEEQSQLKRVAPGDPDNSYLVHKVEGTQESGSQMPRGQPPLDQATLTDIRDWISRGALNN